MVKGVLHVMDHRKKLCHTVDALFGAGVASCLPKSLDMTFSRKTGRIRTVSHDGRLLCTLKIDGGLAVTPHMAQMLLESSGFRENCVRVSTEAAPFVEQGRSVFCKHVEWCGRNIRIADDVPVLSGDTVIAVGRAVLSSEMMRDFGRGVAVRIRKSLKSSGEIQGA